MTETQTNLRSRLDPGVFPAFPKSRNHEDARLRSARRALSFSAAAPIPETLPWAVNPPGEAYFWKAPGARRARPLRRRALITLRPPFVAMRARKPWVRRRDTLWGWYVRFIVVLSQSSLGAPPRRDAEGARLLPRTTGAVNPFAPTNLGYEVRALSCSLPAQHDLGRLPPSVLSLHRR